MEENAKRPLIIPENSPPVQYVINGFKSTDITFIGVFSLLGAIIGIISWRESENPIIGIFVCVLFVVMAILIRVRNAHTENLIDIIRIFFEYLKTQKRYEYKYVNTWELPERKTRNASKKR